MPRPALTLILVTRQTLIRADFADRRAAEVQQNWIHARPDAPELLAAVDLAVAVEPNLGRTVWILSSDLWVETPLLPVSRVRGLNDSELSQALNFEVESYSGIPASEAIAGAVPLTPVNGELPVWVVQARLAERDAIADLVAQAGGRLVGLAHPAAVPRSLLGTADAPFQRLELWPDAVVGIRRDSAGRFDLKIVNSDPPLGRWQSELSAWFVPGPLEVLCADDLHLPVGWTASSVQALLRLSDEDVASDWFARWANELGNVRSKLPIIPVPIPPMSTTRRGLLAGGLFALVLLLCFGHDYYQRRELQELTSAIATAQPDTKEAAAFQALVKTRMAESDKLRAENAKLERGITMLKQQRERHAKLLELLAVHKPEHVVIRSMESTPAGPKVVGIALGADLAHQYSRELFAPLQKLGWEVQPATETAMNKLADGGPWEFEFTILDAAQPTVSAPRSSGK